MITRCFNANCAEYPRYGGRGISVCERWKTFVNFLADMGERPHGTSIDRIDNSRGYEPGNCRWATATEQSRNRYYVKLTPDLVNEIRGRAEHGERPVSIARRIGKDLPNVCQVIARRSWKDIP